MRAIILSATVAGLSFFSLGGGAQSATSLSIDSVSLTRPDPATCTYRWYASTAGDWVPASGTSFSDIPAGETRPFLLIDFVRRANKTLLKVQVHKHAGVLAEKVVGLPEEPAPKVTLANFSASDTAYVVYLVNLLQERYPDLTVKGYAAKDPAAGWVEAGGVYVPCIAASGTYGTKGLKPSGYGLVKVQVIRGSTVIVEQIFGTAAPKQPPTKRPPL